MATIELLSDIHANNTLTSWMTGLKFGLVMDCHAKPHLNSPLLLDTFCSGQKVALFSRTKISTLREMFPRPVVTKHSHSPFASTCTFDKINSLKKLKKRRVTVRHVCTRHKLIALMKSRHVITWWWQCSHVRRFSLEELHSQGCYWQFGRCGASEQRWFCPPGQQYSGTAACLL